MADIRIAVPKAPKIIKVTDNESLLEHAAVMQLRAQTAEMVDARLEPALQRVEEARHALKAAELAAEQVKLELGAIELKERETIRRFYTAARRATPLVRALVERHGGEISFTFDSNGRPVWLVGVFESAGRPDGRGVRRSAVPQFGCSAVLRNRTSSRRGKVGGTRNADRLRVVLELLSPLSY